MRRKRWVGSRGRRKKAKHAPQHKKSAIIDETLLDEYRAVSRCWWCGLRAACQPHHLFGRGQEGCTRFDVRENLAALCVECHQAHHMGLQPMTLDLLAVVAARLHTTQEAIREYMNCLKWGRGHASSEAGSRNGGSLHLDQRGDVPAPLDREPQRDRPSGVEADEDDGDWCPF
jgi:hypothetical protein